MNIHCPYCGGQTGVTDSRGDGVIVLRRRKCLSCNQSLYTEERVMKEWEEGATRLYKLKKKIEEEEDENDRICGKQDQNRESEQGSDQMV